MADVAASMGERLRARALHLFVERGIDATPLREIAEGLDVTKAALYYHHPSKEQLLWSLVVPYHDDLGAALLVAEEAREQGATGSPSGLLAELLEVRLRHREVVALCRDPAVLRIERLAARERALADRATRCLVGERVDEAGRWGAVAALAVLDACVIAATPDDIGSIRAVVPELADRLLRAPDDRGVMRRSEPPRRPRRG